MCPNLAVLLYRRSGSSVDLTAVANTQHEDEKLLVDNIVDDPIITDANPEFTVAARKLNTARRTRIAGETLNGLQEPLSRRPIELSKCLSCRRDVGDRVTHTRSSQTEFGSEIVMRDSKTRFLPRQSSIANIRLILQRLERPIKELRRHDDRTTTRPARGDLDGLALSSRDVVALLTTELGKGH